MLFRPCGVAHTKLSPKNFFESPPLLGPNRRVVVTGLGAITPLGVGVKPSWDNLIASKCGIEKINRFSTEDLAVKVAAFVPEGEGGGLYDDRRFSCGEIESRFIRYAMVAVGEALEDSAWFSIDKGEREKTGVSIGSGIGGLVNVEDIFVSKKRISPYFVPQILVNSAAGYVSSTYKLKGPNVSASTACTTGVHSVGDAANLIRLGYAEMMVAGSTEAAISPLTISGFSKAKALARGESAACNPFSVQRKGFVLGEGAAILILEELEHALFRDAKIYAEVRGYGLSGDAFHITAPSSDGDGAVRSMQSAIKQANIPPGAIGYINAHATGTKIGDIAESKAIKKVFQNNPLVSSTKGATGHLLGASGSVEAVFSILALNTSTIPPTLNLDEPDPECPLNHVTSTITKYNLDAVLTNSFGFGGTNGTLIFTKI